MSAAASEAVMEKAADPAAADELSAPGPMTESDHFETQLEYEPGAKLPILVVLVWVCALVGLGAYSMTYFVPDLALWGK